MFHVQKHWYLILIAAVAVYLLPGCSGGGQKTAEEAKVSETTQSEPAGDYVVQLEGGEGYTVEELRAVVESMPPNQQALYRSDPSALKQLAQNLGDAAAIATAAEEEGFLEKTENQVFVRISKNGMIAQKYINDRMNSITVSDEELKNYYDQNPDQFDQSQVKVNHILVDNEETAKEIYQQLQGHPEKFAALAKEKSLHEASKDKGGDLGYLSRGQMSPEFDRVAFAMAKGEISEPVQTRLGWHVIYLEDKTEAGLAPFDEVKDQIRQRLEQQKKQEEIQDFITEVKDQHKLQINDDLLGEITAVSQPGAPGTPPPPPQIPDEGGELELEPVQE